MKKNLRKVTEADLFKNGRLTFKNGKATYKDGMFVRRLGIHQLIIPEGVTEIEDSAFMGCKSLTSIIIPNSVTSIGGGAFAYCKDLIVVTIGNGIKDIGNKSYSHGTVDTISIFDGCKRLKSVVFKDKTMDEIKSMENYPFGIKNPEEVIIPGIESNTSRISEENFNNSLMNHWVKRINDSMNDEDDEIGDGQFHVFELNDKTTAEKYVILMPDGYTFFLSHKSPTGQGVGTYFEYPYSYSTQDEMEEEFEGEEIFEFTPEIIRGIKLIADNYYKDEDDELYDYIIKNISKMKAISNNSEKFSESNRSDDYLWLKKEKVGNDEYIVKYMKNHKMDKGKSYFTGNWEDAVKKFKEMADEMGFRVVRDDKTLKTAVR